MWKIKVPSKLEVFLWRLAQHSIPTSHILHHRHMYDVVPCVLCGVEDSWRHVLMGCTMARCVWSLTDGSLVEHVCPNLDTNAKNWIFGLHDSLSEPWFVRLAVTLWAIWGARRKAIYENIFQSPLSTHHFIGAFLDDLQVIEVPRSSHAGGAPVARQTQWIQPPVTLSKINLDAATPRNNRFGAVAAVCRNHDGVF